jgi:hypothetical protein
MIIMVDHADLGAALATPSAPDVGEPPGILSEWMGRGLLVVVRKSREPNLILLLR